MKSDKSYAELADAIIRLLHEERESQKVSKYQMEQRCGLSQQMIGYVERGLRRPSLETALRMASGLGLNLDDVIKEARKSVKRK